MIALFLSLAGLAEMACRRSRAVRALVIFILRPAECIAWKYVTGETQPLEYAIPFGDSANHALLLAQRFRELAYTLEWELYSSDMLDLYWNDGTAWLSRFGVDTHDLKAALGGTLAVAAAVLTADVPYPDTS